MLNASHPYFCDHHHRHHNDDDDGDDYYNGHDHDHKNDWAPCGNERFEFTWKNVKYSKKDFDVVMSWSDLISTGSQQVFAESIGSFQGNNTLWTQSHWRQKQVKRVGIAHIVFSVIGLIAALKMIRRTFYGDSRVEKLCRWMKTSFWFLITFSLAVAALALIADMEIFDHPHHSHHGHDDDHDDDHHSKYTPSWDKHYPQTYGCHASPRIYSIALAVWGFTSAILVVMVIWLRACCLRCKSRDLDDAQRQWKLGKCVSISTTTASTPVLQDTMSVNSVPPPYGTGYITVAEEKAALSSSVA